MRSTKKVRLSDQIVVRVEPKLRDSIAARADRERRPISNLIRNILADKFNQPELEGAA
jgi:hypothetical protein